MRVPGQCRLAISRLRVSNPDAFVHTATGNLFSIGAPRHRQDPEIIRSQETNQQKQRGKNLSKKNLKKKIPIRVPGQRRLAFTSSKIPKKIEEEKKRKKLTSLYGL